MWGELESLNEVFVDGFRWWVEDTLQEAKQANDEKSPDSYLCELASKKME